jgi:GTP cyclohydrolase III
MMDAEQFWVIIDKLKDSSLRDMLNRLTSNEILQFELRFDSLMAVVLMIAFKISAPILSHMGKKSSITLLKIPKVVWIG